MKTWRICAVVLMTVLSVQQAFAEGVRPGLYKGTIGIRKVALTLVLDEQTSESVLGSYTVEGSSASISVAGEWDQNHLSMEESRNGTDVSGEFSGLIHGDALEGTWTDEGDGHTEPFSLRFEHP